MPPATCGAESPVRWRRPAASARGTLRSCIWCRRARARCSPTARARSGSASAARMPAANPSGVAVVRIATSSSSTCVCVEQPGGDDRPARSQVLINLQRCVGPGAARRDQHVGRVEKRAGSLRRHAARQTRPHAPSPAARACARARSICSGRPPASTNRASGRDRDDVPRRRKQQIESLVGLERAGVENDRRVVGEPELAAHARCPSRRRGASPEPGAFSISTAGTPGSIARTTSCRCGQITTTTRERRTTNRSIRREQAREHARAAEREIRQLLRQARMHVVEMRHAEQPPRSARRCCCPLRASGRHRTDPTQRRRIAVNASVRSSGIFAIDGPIRTSRTNGGRRHRKTRRPGIDTSRPNGYVTRSTVWPSSSKRANAMVFAERRSPGLEERLRGNHEDSHSAVARFLGNAAPKGQRKSRRLRELRRGQRLQRVQLPAAW